MASNPTEPSTIWVLVLGIVGTALTVASGIYALLRKLFVTREELQSILEKLEENHERAMEELERRHEAKIAEIAAIQERMHRDNVELQERFFKDNVEGRHRLRDALAGPVNKLNSEIILLRRAIEHGKLGDSE